MRLTRISILSTFTWLIVEGAMYVGLMAPLVGAIAPLCLVLLLTIVAFRQIGRDGQHRGAKVVLVLSSSLVAATVLGQSVIWGLVQLDSEVRLANVLINLESVLVLVLCSVGCVATAISRSRLTPPISADGGPRYGD